MAAVPKILIIEDDAVARRLLHAALTAKKYEAVILQGVATILRLAMIPAVVISGQDPATAEEPALAAGARVFPPEPVRPEDVVAKVEEIPGPA